MQTLVYDEVVDHVYAAIVNQRVTYDALVEAFGYDAPEDRLAFAETCLTFCTRYRDTIQRAFPWLAFNEHHIIAALDRCMTDYQDDLLVAD